MHIYIVYHVFIYLTSALKQKEIEDEAQKILLKYLGNYTALYDLIKYDEKDCSFQDRRKSFRKLMPCSIPQILKALSEVYNKAPIYIIIVGTHIYCHGSPTRCGLLFFLTAQIRR